MTDESMALKVLLGKVSDADFLRQSLESILQLLMEKDVSEQIGAQRSKRHQQGLYGHMAALQGTLDAKCLELRVKNATNHGFCSVAPRF